MATFEMAQKIMERRRRQSNNYVGKKSGRYPFSGIITCGLCGASYKRKTANKKTYWQCSSYLREGHSGCCAKQIPEEILLRETAAVLKLDSFDENAFEREIESMTVPKANHIIYLFRDGRSVNSVWQALSRRDSWSEEMRQAARDRMTPELREASRQRIVILNERKKENGKKS